MSYIRGALPFLIYNPNTRDDIVPDGVTQRFELSQEVPGGYEGNVQVIKREYKLDALVQSSPLISFGSSVLPSGDVEYKIICENAPLAAALSVVNPGDVILVSGASNDENNTAQGHIVLSTQYDGSTVSLSVEPEVPFVIEAAGALVSLSRRFTGPWEVLEPEIDYKIFPDQNNINKIIGFTTVPQEKDTIYVIHRGEATYNFVPTEKSVGPAQLSDNLRSFKLNVFTGNGSQTDFELTIDAPDEIVNARTLEVSVDGVLKYGTDSSLGFTGDFELLADKKTIRFASAPANGSKIHVRNLGFSTVSRRASLSPTQTGALSPNSVGTQQLQNGAVTEAKLATNSVSGTIIQTDAVNDAKILLRNNEWLRAESGTTPGAKVSILKIDASNQAVLRSAGGPLSLNIADTRVIQVSTSAILDATSTGQVDLGTLSNKFKDAYLAGSLQAQNASLSGTLSVTGESTFNDVVINGDLTIAGSLENSDIADLQAQVAALAALVAQATPSGSIKLWATDTGAPTGYLLCDGNQYSKTTYANLYTAIGDFFNQHPTLGAPSPGNFRVPDFRGRFPLGKSASGTGSGWGVISGQGGALDHSHNLPSHVHSLNGHSHSIDGHYHGMRKTDGTDIGADLNIDGTFNASWYVGGTEANTRTKRGGHDTSLQHVHQNATTDATNAYTSNALTNLGSTPTPTTLSHSHRSWKLNSYPGGSDVSDSVRGATDVSGAHKHSIPNRSGNANVGSSGTTYLLRGGNTNQGGSTGSPDLHGSDEAPHAHTVYIASWTTDDSPSLQHFHGIPQTPLLLPYSNIRSTDSSGIVQSSANSVSTGTHSHSKESIRGRIGKVSGGANGDDGFTSGPASGNTLGSIYPGSAVAADGTSGGANPAFQTINFIIKT